MNGAVIAMRLSPTASVFIADFHFGIEFTASAHPASMRVFVTAEIEDLRLSTVMNLVSFVFTISSFSFLNILAEWGGRSLNSAGVSSEARTSRLPHPKQESTLRRSPCRTRI